MRVRLCFKQLRREISDRGNPSALQLLTTSVAPFQLTNILVTKLSVPAANAAEYTSGGWVGRPT